MFPLERCALCGADELREVASSHFARPSESAAALAAQSPRPYVPLRLAVMFEELLPDRDEHHVRTMACAQCAFVGLDPGWTEAELARKYARLGELLPAPTPSTDPRARTRSARVKQLVDRWRPRAADARRVIDVGGSCGTMLQAFLETGDDCSVLDFAPGELLAGVRHAGATFADLAGADLADADGAGTHPDVVLCLHTLEHVADPRGFLASLANLLTDDAILVLEVPLGTVLECRELAEPITHVSFFCEESLHRACLAENLRVLHVASDYQWVGHSRMWCVNLVARRADGQPSANPVSAARQQSLLGQLWQPRHLARHPVKALRALASNLRPS